MVARRTRGHRGGGDRAGHVRRQPLTEILNQAFIYQSEINEIIRIARQWPRIETGGDLYGTFTHGGALAIWLVSGPGPAAAHQETQFSQDVAFTTESQRLMMTRFALQYIGSWHSHHVM